MLGTILRLLRPAKSPEDNCKPAPTVISGPDDGELVGKYDFGYRAWAEVRRKFNDCYELGDLYGDPAVPGRGTALLREICRRADVLGSTLSIHVMPPPERRSDEEKDRLRALYAVHGFEEYFGREKWMLRCLKRHRLD